MASSSKQREARTARERTRKYQARQSLYADQKRRRTRDNLIAGIGGGILLLAIVAGQVAFYVSGPGAPGPAASPTPTSTSPDIGSLLGNQ
ncbi:dioxygenase [Microbacterium sp. X-17]|uniref:dioxygenase n=1 Tax=Microbacterium sp. X-17 TaxID=3144404 RepID=UPI0031F5AF53